jgi:purine-binding chemotaxis protein CheW
MNVKEIAKADKFTYVPNTASYVRGVYNLRGDIIPIIDLRNFFHLPIDKKNDSVENMLILHINDLVYGTIVDKIDKVVGINHESIQPPHPIFGDINIKYISGVVEKQGDLYIILDVVRIFTVSDEDKNKSRTGVTDSGEYFVPPPPSGGQTPQQAAASNTAIDFIQESLLALKRFAVTELNISWLYRRFADWKEGRSGEALQIKTAQEADDFLSPFHSPHTGEFWSDTYANSVKKVLPDFSTSIINVWNIGCGKGYETYSFACILKTRYPNARFKIWANDNDVMAVSQAPNMAYDLDVIPEYCRPFTVKGNSGYLFNPAIKDSIVFEYHDVVNENALPELDIIMVRDVVSFLSAADQARVLSGFSERLKNRGVIFVGRNEELTGAIWQSMADDPVSAYLHCA